MKARWECPCPNCIFICQLGHVDGWLCHGPHYYQSRNTRCLYGPYVENGYTCLRCEDIESQSSDPITKGSLIYAYGDPGLRAQIIKEAVRKGLLCKALVDELGSRA